MKRHSKRRSGGYKVSIGRKVRRFRLKRALMKAVRRARHAGRKVGPIQRVAVAHKRKSSRRRSRRVHSNRRRTHRRRSFRANRRHSRRRRSRR